MDDTSLGNTFEQEEPKEPTPLGSPKPTQYAQPQNKVDDTLNNVEQLIKVTAPSVEKENPEVVIVKIASLPIKLISQ